MVCEQQAAFQSVHSFLREISSPGKLLRYVIKGVHSHTQGCRGKPVPQTEVRPWPQGTVLLWCQHPERRGSICEGQCMTPVSTLWWLSDPSHLPQVPPLYFWAYFPPAGLHPDQQETGAGAGCWWCARQVLLSVSASADLCGRPCMHVHTCHTGVLLRAYWARI